MIGVRSLLTSLDSLLRLKKFDGDLLSLRGLSSLVGESIFSSSVLQLHWLMTQSTKNVRILLVILVFYELLGIVSRNWKLSCRNCFLRD